MKLLLFSIFLVFVVLSCGNPTVQRFKARLIKKIAIGLSTTYSGAYDGGNMPYSIAFYNNYYYLLWYGNGPTVIQKIFAKGGAYPYSGEAIYTAFTPSNTYMTLLYASSYGLYALGAASPYSSMNLWMVDPNTLAFTVVPSFTITPSNTKNFSPGFGTALTGTCASTLCYLYYTTSTSPPSIRRMLFNGADQATYAYSTTLLGNEYDTTSPLRTRTHGAIWDDGSAVLLDTVAGVFRRYNASSYSGTPPTEHYLWPADGAVFHPENYIGRTADGLDWIADLTNGYLRGYDLQCCTFWGNNTDTVAPTVTFPSNVVYNPYPYNYSLCEDDSYYHPNVTGWPVASDNCMSATALSITYSDQNVAGLPPYCSQSSLRSSNRVVIQRTWRVEDSCGNFVTSVQTITLYGYPIYGDAMSIAALNPNQECGSPTLPPILQCRQTFPSSFVSSWLGVSDSVIWTATSCTPTSPNIRQVTRTYSGYGCDGTTLFTGWRATTSETVMLADTTPPSLSVTDYTWNSYTLPNTAYLITASDSCTYSTVTVTFVDAVVSDMGTGSCPGSKVVRVVHRLVNAVDTCGNVATATQVITVVDSTSPTFSIPSGTCTCAQLTDTTLGLAYCGSPISVADDIAISSNPSEYIVSYTTSPSTCSGSGNYIRTWTITDKCGNTKVMDQTITVP